MIMRMALESLDLIHDDIVIPYQMIVDSLKFFFGSSSVVQFNLL